MAEVGISLIDSKPVEGLHIELMKLRRYYAGKKHEAWIRKRMYENQEKKWIFSNTKEIEECTREMDKYDLFVVSIDGVLKSCGIEVLENYKLKSELNEERKT